MLDMVKLKEKKNELKEKKILLVHLLLSSNFQAWSLLLVDSLIHFVFPRENMLLVNLLFSSNFQVRSPPSVAR